MVIGFEPQPRRPAPEPVERAIEVGAAPELASGHSGPAKIDAGVDLTTALPCFGSGSIGQIATLPSSRWRKRIPEKLALATCAAPIAS